VACGNFFRLRGRAIVGGDAIRHDACLHRRYALRATNRTLAVPPDPRPPTPMPPTPLPPTPQSPQGVPPPIDDPRAPGAPEPLREPPIDTPPAVADR
jgi:hypothetical protein